MKSTLLLPLVMATALSAPCQQKKPFTLTIHPEHHTVKVGQPVVIDAVKTNTSDSALNLAPTNNPAEYYDMDVMHDGVKAEPTANLQKLKADGGRHMTSMLLSTVKPGKSMKESVGVSQYYDMSQPGAYTVCFHQNGVSSNTVTVLVQQDE